MNRKLATILAADVVGYSAHMERDELGTFERIRAVRKELFEPEIARHRGRVFKIMGDGLLAEFSSVADAVECAVALQTGLGERNAAVPEDDRVQVRIGVNLGEVIVEDEDCYGEGVNIAARLQQIAEPGDVYVTDKVVREVEKKLAIGFEAMGERKVKNLAEPVPVFRVQPKAFGATIRAELERGRDCYRRRAWADAFAAFARADQEMPLAAEDLERMAMSAFLTNRDEDCLRALERSHHAYLDAGQCAHAARAAFWLGFRLVGRGEIGPATGWFARAQRVLKNEAADCVERGYLLLPTVEQQLAAGDRDAAFRTATAAAEIGERFRDADLVAAALHLQGRVLIRQGQVEPGLLFSTKPWSRSLRASSRRS